MLNFTSKIKLSNQEAQYLGRIDYSKAYELQKDLAVLTEKKQTSFILGLEHPDVVTLGRRAKPEDEVFLKDIEIPVLKSTRGGLATIHSVGQLVIYPILNLRTYNLGAKAYVQWLLQTTQKLLQQLGVESSIDENQIGLYTKNGKIAFCGIQIKNGVSYHGISLNVRNDLDLFDQIRSCGAMKPQLDRLQNYGVTHTLEELFQIWVRLFINDSASFSNSSASDNTSLS